MKNHNSKFKTTDSPIFQFIDSPIDLVVSIICKLLVNGLFFTVYCVLFYSHKFGVGVEFIRLGNFGNFFYGFNESNPYIKFLYISMVLPFFYWRMQYDLLLFFKLETPNLQPAAYIFNWSIGKLDNW